MGEGAKNNRMGEGLMDFEKFFYFTMPVAVCAVLFIGLLVPLFRELIENERRMYDELKREQEKHRHTYLVRKDDESA